MVKFVEYEVEISKGHIVKFQTCQSLRDLKKEHKELGYKLVSYNGKRVFNIFNF